MTTKIEKQKRVQDKLKKKRDELRSRLGSKRDKSFPLFTLLLLLGLGVSVVCNLRLLDKVRAGEDERTTSSFTVECTTLTEQPYNIRVYNDFRVVSYTEEMGEYTTVWGSTLTPDKSCAVDPRIVPYGAYVIIDGVVYVAEDTGEFVVGSKTIGICTAQQREAFISDIIIVY